ncbi:MAG: DNA polymerase Y family protein [Pseudomonadota bacterium]
MVVIDTIKNAMRIIAMAADSRLAGIRVGQTLSDARAIYPDIECVPHNLDADRALLVKVARWCERYTPLVSLSGQDGLFLDITGCAHLFDGEQSMLEDINRRLEAQGFGVKSAIADTAGAAWAIARYGDAAITLPNAHKIALEPLSLRALRLPLDTIGALAQVGFKTIGCLVDLPRAPIVARFGETVLQRLDQALGSEDEVLSPLQPVAELVYEKRFPDPIVYEDDIKTTIKTLTIKLKVNLEQRGRGMRRCRLQLFRADGEVVQLEVEASQPLRNAHKIAALFDERLASLHDEWDAGFGFDIIQLCVLRSDKLDAYQEDLVSSDQSEEVVTHLIDRLSVRLGQNRVLHYQAADTHIPERRFALAPALHHRQQALPVYDTGIATRPVLLFDRPELAEVMAEVPEGPPIRFRWRRVSYEVTRSEGPERIACEWWKDGRAAHTRDYFRIETTNGYRLWLFRHGLYERETDTPKWYVHGMFA